MARRTAVTLFLRAMGFLPGVEMTTRFVAPAVRDSTNDPAVNPLDDTAIDDPYTLLDSIVVSSGPSPGLLVTASPYCVELLTESGNVTTTEACPDP